MKLDKHLNSLIGKELTAEQVAIISTEIDNIKVRATEKLTSELNEVKVKFKEVNKQLTDHTLKDTFTAAGGDPEKLASFKKVLGKGELTEEAIQAVFEEFPSLKAQSTQTTEQTQDTEQDNEFGFTNNLSNFNDPRSQQEEPAGETDSNLGTVV